MPDEFIDLKCKQTACQQKKAFLFLEKLFCDPAEARTQDPQIKSLLLYQLSYEVDRSQM